MRQQRSETIDDIQMVLWSAEILERSEFQVFEQAYLAWLKDRQQFNKDLKFSITDASQQKWMKSYFQGKNHDGDPAPEHQTKIVLPEFKRDDQ